MDEPEGATPLDPDEAAGLKLDSIQTRSDLDRVEQANIIDGLRWLRGRRDPDLLSEAFLLELHRQLFGQVWQWAGRFRQTEKTIGVDPMVIGERLRLLLEDCRYWIEHHTYPAKELALRLDELENKSDLIELKHDTFAHNTRVQLKQVFDAIRELMAAPEPETATARRPRPSSEIELLENLHHRVGTDLPE